MPALAVVCGAFVPVERKARGLGDNCGYRVVTEGQENKDEFCE